MNTQYRKNLKAVMQVNKNYTDSEIKKSEGRILSIVARNNVSYIDHTDEATYRFTAPLNSKLLMLQSIAGNSNKIAPSTPSDDSVARLKVIPDNTYKSQIDYIGGKSVKYNQLVQNGNFDNTSNWSYWSQVSTFSVSNNEMTVTSGGAGCSLAQVLSETIPSGHKVIVSFEAKSNDSTDTLYFQYYNGATLVITEQTDSALTTSFKRFNIITTLANQATRIQFYRGLASGSIIFRQVALIDLTDKFGAGNEPSDVATAIPLLKANGYKLDGTDTYSIGDFKHAIVSGVKYEAVNLMNLVNRASTTTKGITYEVVNNKITFNGTATGTIFIDFTLETAINVSDNNYSINLFNKQANSGLYVYGTDLYNNGIYTFANYVSIVNYSRANLQLINGLLRFSIRISEGTIFNNYEFTPMLVKGSTAPSTYIPYVAPITKAIPSEVLADSRYGLGFDNTNYNKLDCNTKHLSGTRNKSKLKLINWEYQSDYLRFRAVIDIREYNTNEIANVLINEYKVYSWNAFTASVDMAFSTYALSESVHYIYIRDTRFDNATNFKNHFTDDDYLEYDLNEAFDVDYSQYFTDGWNKVDLDNLYASCEMVVDEPIDMPNKLEYYGTIIHALATAVKQDGFNVWDEEYEVGAINENGQNVPSASYIRSKNYISVSPDITYYSKTPNYNVVLFYFDINKNIISYVGSKQNTTFTTPSNCYYVRFHINMNYFSNDICINISNQTLNGTYKPYKATITRLLPNSEAKYSWGIADGVRNTRVFCDDECNPVGKGQVDVGNQDLGDLNWGKTSVFYTDINGLKDGAKGLCNKFPVVSFEEISPNEDFIQTRVNSQIYFRYVSGSIYESMTSNIFKSAMNGIPLFFEKNATDTEPLDDFDFSFDCEEGDTFTIIGCELLQCYATYSFLIKEAKSNE